MIKANINLTVFYKTFRYVNIFLRKELDKVLHKNTSVDGSHFTIMMAYHAYRIYFKILRELILKAMH